MKDSVVLFSKKFLKHELINGSFYIFAGSIAGSFLSYFFNLFLARKLSYADYGTITALISFVGLMVIPTQSITTVLVQYATNFFSKKEIPHAASLYVKSLRVMMIVALLVFFLLFVFSGGLAHYFKIYQPTYILLAGMLISLGYISIVNNAFIQSQLRFGFVSVLNFLGSLSKIVVGVILIVVGFKVFGALGALIVSSLIPFLVGFFPLKFLFFQKEKSVHVPWGGMVGYAIFVTLTTFSLSSFISTDIILVKHFFTPSEAGLYGGLSTIGKSIYYLTAPIATVLFPIIINRFNQGKNFHKTFYLAIALVLLPSICAVLLYFLFPQFVILIFLGGKAYLQLIPVLWLYGLFITVYSILNICVTFFLSLKKTTIAFPMMVGAIVQFLAINMFHKNFQEVITMSLVTSGILLIMILLYYLKTYGKKKENI